MPQDIAGAILKWLENHPEDMEETGIIRIPKEEYEKIIRTPNSNITQ